MKNLSVKYDNLKLTKVAKYSEETEGEDKTKFIARFVNKDVTVSITKKDMFVGLIVGQEYKVTVGSDQQILVTEAETEDEESD